MRWIARTPTRRRGRRIGGWAASALGPVVTTAALAPGRPDIDTSTVLLLFLLPVLLAAAVGGLGPALAASALGFVLSNWFFIPPLHTWEVEHVDNVVALVVFLLVGCVVSWYGATAGRREAEAASAAAATDLRNALLAAVSHDLRTPLASIKASVTSLLADDVQWDDDDRRQFTETIDAETDRLTTLVTNLLDMSRLTTGGMVVHRMEVGLDEIVYAAVRSLGERAAPEALDVDVDEQLPPLTTDAHLLERAVANVVDNALAWSPPGRSVRVRATGRDGWVDLTVSDDGPGIPVADRERVFLPFQRGGDRSHGARVGLGLAVARGMVQAVGGTIAVVDATAGGTTVRISVPVVPGEEM